MAEYIERNGAIDALRRRLGPNTSHAQKTMLLLAAIDIRGIKAANVAPVRHGRWIPCDNGGYYCSDCDHRVAFIFNNRYCPNCGSKMDGGVENATA